MTRKNVNNKPVGKPSKCAETERLNTWLPEIAAALLPESPVKPQPEGSVRIGNKGALSVGPGTGLWYDHAAGEGGRDAPSLIRHLGADNPSDWVTRFLADHEGTGSLSDAQDETTESQNKASRLAIDHFVSQSQPIEGTAAETYLQSRGINAPYPTCVGYVADARVGEGAMVAVVAGPDGAAAVQLTYITPGGDKSTVAPARRLYVGQTDWFAGGGFALTENGPPARTIIVEGVEDALSLQQAQAGTCIVASLGASNIGKAPADKTLPVVVFKDGDAEDSQAAKGLTKGVDRLILQGAAVAVTDTPLGEDANSILQSDGPSALLALIAAAVPADLSTKGHIERCAGLGATEYEEARIALAKKLRIRVSFLDAQVKAFRREIDEEDVPPNALGIEEIEAWPEPVNLADVLDDATKTLAQYIAADSTLILTAVLWAAHTHILDRINVSPRLAAQAAGPGCGKTVAMEAISNLVPRPLSASSITAAAVFRIIEEIQPTLLLDEADQILADRNSLLVAVLNSSHRKSSAFVMRTEEVLPGQFKPVRFSTWAAVMFAGIRELPPTLQDRSVVLYLRRAKPGEVGRHLRDGKCPELSECAQKMARWASDLVELPEVALPPTLSNRIGDNWRPLLAVAELAGGKYPTRAMESAMAAAQQQEQGQISMLLADIHLVFGARNQILSQELVDGLLGLDETPYGDLNRGRAITTNWLARQLKGIVTQSTTTMQVGKDRKKGYTRAAFTDAWERYGIAGLDKDVRETPSKTTVTTVTTGQMPPSNGHSGTDGARLSEGPNPNGTAGCHVVTDDTDDTDDTDEKEGFSETPVYDEAGAVDEGDDTCLL
jgi:putative DNA primase/helicase